MAVPHGLCRERGLHRRACLCGRLHAVGAAVSCGKGRGSGRENRPEVMTNAWTSQGLCGDADNGLDR